MRFERATAEDVAKRADDLATLLQECSRESGVGFLPPVADATARAYWESVARDVAAGSRVLLLARESAGGPVAGSAQLALAQQANGRHRAEVQKVMVLPALRRRGIALALLRALEDEARREGRSTLVLDTWAGGGGEELYARAGWTRAGEIPAFARRPDGTLGATALYWKRL